jgi:hypothetical protein
MLLALRKLVWSRWEPSIHLYVGGARNEREQAKWRPFLSDVEVHWTSNDDFARNGDWAQSDDVFRFPTANADVVIAIDADTFPVQSLEHILDEVADTQSMAGVIAHYPNVISPSDASVRDAWKRMASGLIDVPLDFPFVHSLVSRESPPESRVAPFYLNFGLVFFARKAFADVAPRYLSIRPQLMGRMPYPDFSGQVALTLAATSAAVKTEALPMRYNFPNDPVAERMYPEELEHVVVFHYLRTTSFDRHLIFTSEEQYSRFLALTLKGVDLRFQQSVKSIIGPEYPFR